jgi:hypothetical protein
MQGGRWLAARSGAHQLDWGTGWLLRAHGWGTQVGCVWLGRSFGPWVQVMDPLVDHLGDE